MAHAGGDDMVAVGGVGHVLELEIVDVPLAVCSGLPSSAGIIPDGWDHQMDLTLS